MKLTVGHKLFLSVLVVSLIVIALIVGLTTWNLRQGFSTYLAQTELNRQSGLVKRLEDVYAARGNWALFKEDPAAWTHFIQTDRVSKMNDSKVRLAVNVVLDDWEASQLVSALPSQDAAFLRVQFTRNDQGTTAPGAEPRQQAPTSAADPNRRTPQSAYDDCRGKNEGDEVWHRTRDGILRSTCVSSPEGLVARPNRSTQNQGRSSGNGSGNSASTAQRPNTPPLQPSPQVSPEKILTLEPETVDMIAARRYVLMDRDGRYLAGMRAAATDTVVTRVLMNEQKPVGQLGLVVTAAATAMDRSFVDHSIEMVLTVAVLALMVSMAAALLTISPTFHLDLAAGDLGDATFSLGRIHDAYHRRASGRIW